MKTITKSDAIKTITTHYIDGGLVESHGREIMDIVRPTDRRVIAQVTLGDEEDTRRAIAGPSAPLPLTARRNRRIARNFCAGCTEPLRRGLTT